MKNGSWEEIKEKTQERKSSEWTLERIRETHEKVASDEIGRLGIVQEILRKSSDFLRRVIAPIGGVGGVTLSHVCLHDGTRRRQQQKDDALQLVVCVVWRQKRVERAPNKILVVQFGTNANEAKVFKAALKMLAKQQTDGDSPRHKRNDGRAEKFHRNRQPRTVQWT